MCEGISRMFRITECIDKNVKARNRKCPHCSTSLLHHASTVFVNNTMHINLSLFLYVFLQSHSSIRGISARFTCTIERNSMQFWRLCRRLLTMFCLRAKGTGCNFEERGLTFRPSFNINDWSFITIIIHKTRVHTIVLLLYSGHFVCHVTFGDRIPSSCQVYRYVMTTFGTLLSTQTWLRNLPSSWNSQTEDMPNVVGTRVRPAAIKLGMKSISLNVGLLICIHAAARRRCAPPYVSPVLHSSVSA